MLPWNLVPQLSLRLAFEKFPSSGAFSVTRFGEILPFGPKVSCLVFCSCWNRLCNIFMLLGEFLQFWMAKKWTIFHLVTLVAFKFWPHLLFIRWHEKDWPIRQASLDMTCVTRLGYFWKVWVTNLLAKEALISSWWFLGLLLKNVIFWVKTDVTIFGYIWKTLGCILFRIWSHWICPTNYAQKLNLGVFSKSCRPSIKEHSVLTIQPKAAFTLARFTQ